MPNDHSPDNDSPVGYKKPPVQHRFQKGQSGNPRGRPKKKPAFLDDAAVILGAPVTGQAKGKQITMALEKALFRRLCQKALNGNNAALRQVVNLVLVLEPEARQEAAQNAKENDDPLRKLKRMAGLDPDEVYVPSKEPDPKWEEWNKRADAAAKVEYKRLIREAKEKGRI